MFFSVIFFLKLEFSFFLKFLRFFEVSGDVIHPQAVISNLFIILFVILRNKCHFETCKFSCFLTIVPCIIYERGVIESNGTLSKIQFKLYIEKIIQSLNWSKFQTNQKIKNSIKSHCQNERNRIRLSTKLLQFFHTVTEKS